MFVLTESQIDIFASDGTFIQNPEDQIKALRIFKWVFLSFYTVRMLNWAVTEFFMPSPEVIKTYGLTQHKFFEIFGWYNFTFSLLLMIMMIGIHVVIFVKWFQVQKYLRINGVI